MDGERTVEVLIMSADGKWWPAFIPAPSWTAYTVVIDGGGGPVSLSSDLPQPTKALEVRPSVIEAELIKCFQQLSDKTGQLPAAMSDPPQSEPHPEHCPHCGSRIGVAMRAHAALCVSINQRPKPPPEHDSEAAAVGTCRCSWCRDQVAF